MEGKTKLNTAEWWIGRHGPFTVPIEGPDDCCEHWAMRRICEANGRPPGEADSNDTHH